MDKIFEKEISQRAYLKYVDGGPSAVKGISSSGIHCGLKPDNQLDLALFRSEQPCKTVSFFTTNNLKGAHVIVFKETLRASRGRCGAVLVNSKNANCSTGKQGEKDNLLVAKALSEKLAVPPENVLFASTGVIGEPLPVDTVVSGMDNLISELDDSSSDNAARAIMTTDTKPKIVAVEVKHGKKSYTIGGVAKGSGMISPNMATMLSFIFTDLDLPTAMLRSVSEICVQESFNSISVDGDMSPNDTVMVMANGMSGIKIAAKETARRNRFLDALGLVCRQLAREIVRDGEGATKLVHIEIKGAVNDREAKLMAQNISNSLLVKTAIFGEDPNWGRIVSAAGTSGAEFDPLLARLIIDGVCVYDRGKPMPRPQNIMKNKDVFINLDAGLGRGSSLFWTCDLSYDYVKINAEYTT
ncbi:MAG TPA: bifunctional glutamate N-acetyltransferase/amino-acid acetyltransferase ArgJ [bacterium]|mgnify:CR=1 FL=1|nr:bifunctional glutamate N-acetyltransferase/amino-acid acetyltransferase ArgJ [bacterium]